MGKNTLTMVEFNLENVKQLCSEYGIRYVELLKQKMQTPDSKGYTRVASGKMLASLHTEGPDEQGEHLVLYLNHLPYMKDLELGGPKRDVPAEPTLLDWVKAKGLGGGSLPVERSIAYAVHYKILAEGTDGRPLMEETKNELYKDFERRLGEALQLDIWNFIQSPEMNFEIRFEVN